MLISSKIVSGINGNVKIPGDKSISHRSIIIPSISNGISEISNLLWSKDVINTLNAFKSLGVKIHFITDGDVWGVISVANLNPKIDLYIGTGGSPEGVLAAAALSCLNCQMQTRLIFNNDEEIKRAKLIGITDLNRKYSINDLVSGDVIFCATGVTDGHLVHGIKDLGDTFEAETFVLHKNTKTNKKVKNIIKK